VPVFHLKDTWLFENDFEAFFAEVELGRFRFRVVGVNGLDPLDAAFIVGGSGPDQFHGLAGFDSFADVEEAVFLSILGDEDFGDGGIGLIFDGEGIIFGPEIASLDENKDGRNGEETPE
jgi:hypothetical protein